jgi:hypothetical protein
LKRGLRIANTISGCARVIQISYVHEPPHTRSAPLRLGDARSWAWTVSREQLATAGAVLTVAFSHARYASGNCMSAIWRWHATHRAVRCTPSPWPCPKLRSSYRRPRKL